MHEQWPSHDMRRPRPDAITPAASAAQAPAGAVVLFDGRSLEGWSSLDGSPAPWHVRDGYFEVAPRTGDIQTTSVFGDVQLHLEWAAPLPVRGDSQGRGNSGVFMMGIYEIQVLDSYDNPSYADGYAGAIYGQHPPIFNATTQPGEWQVYDIVFRRPRFDAAGELVSPARLTIFHNGICIQNNVELRGPTGWMAPLPYSAHADKLPLRLQDHGDPVRFRNIWLVELPDPAERIPPPAPPLRSDVSEAELVPYVGRYCRDTFCATISLDAAALWLNIGG
ncbi:MAG TPA: DUF1080 domain-containing protein, partial [Roseiflexaceae bacterium]|nr:DUF1080 domain-containing protein [Roseiflexaceae bacterium]